MTKYPNPRNLLYWKNLLRRFPYSFKSEMRRTLRRLKLMKPYEPLDAYNRPYPLEHVLSCTGKGWENLLRECYTVCVEYGIDIHQVKEKFGGLRFYVGGSSRRALNKIDSICDRSYVVCENCGKPGELDSGRNWYKTLCPSCTQVDNRTASRELEHLLSPSALEDWKNKVSSGEVGRTVMKLINALRVVKEK